MVEVVVVVERVASQVTLLLFERKSLSADETAAPQFTCDNNDGSSYGKVRAG